MNFFKTITEKFPNADLNIRIKAKGTSVTISVLPMSTKENNIQPILVTGTAEELDQQFISLIEKPLAEAIAEIVNLDEHKESIEAEKKSATTPAEKPKADKPKNRDTKPGAKAVEAPKPVEGNLFENGPVTSNEPETNQEDSDDQNEEEA